MCSEPTLRAGSRAPAWPAGNGSGLLLVEHRRETGSGPARRVGAGGNGLWCARGERVVVRGSVPRPALSSEPPEPEQGIPVALQHPTLCFLSSQGVGRCPCWVSEPREPQPGFPGPHGSPSSIPVPISATSSQRRLAPYLIFPLPIKKQKTKQGERSLPLSRKDSMWDPRGPGQRTHSRFLRHRGGRGGSGRAKQSRAAPPFPSAPQPRLCATRIFIELIY